MSRPDYTALDAAIIARITNGWTAFNGIFARECRAEAERLESASHTDPRQRKSAFQLVDSRLQALRRAGKIVDSRAGWQIKDGS